MLIVEGEQLGDVQALGAVVHAVAAGGAGEHLAVHHAASDVQQGGPLGIGEGLVGLEGVQVGLQLLLIGHAGEDHGDAGHTLEEAEGPAHGALAGPQGAELLRLFIGQPGQAAAPQGLHDPDGDVPAVELGRLVPGLLEVPVQIVELELAELHVLPHRVQELPDHRQGAVGGKAQVADAAVPLLLQQILHHPILGGEVWLHVALVHVVEQIEVEVLHAAAAQLLLKNGLHPVGPDVVHIVAGELVCQEEALPGIAGQGLAHHHLGLAAVVAVGGVEVVGPPGHGGVHHPVHRGLVYILVPAAGQQGQAHAAKAQLGQGQVLKLLGNHRHTLLWFCCPHFTT